VTGKSRIYRLIILAIAALAVAGCSPPLGGIGGSGDRGGGITIPNADDLEVEYPPTYTVGDYFTRNDLRVFPVSNGERASAPLPNSAYDVSIIEDPENSPEEMVPVGNTYQFNEEGAKIILVEYGDLSFRCHINVLEEGAEEDGESSTGISILWLVP